MLVQKCLNELGTWRAFFPEIPLRAFKSDAFIYSYFQVTASE